METTPRRTCLNCECALTEDSKYCPQCGQKVTHVKLTVFELGREFLSAIVQLDGKFWKTLGALIRRPGFLTKEYLEGRRVRYLRPITLTMLFTGVFFLLVEWDMSKSPKFSELPINDDEQVQLHLGPGFEISMSGQQLRELNSLSKSEIDELLSSKGIVPHSWSGFLAERALQMLSDEGLTRFQHRLLQFASRSVALLIPAMAGVVWLLHRRKNLFYVEATIFALHLHCFLFLCLLPNLLLPAQSSARQIGTAAIFLVMIGYTTMSLRVAFDNSWFWSLMKAGTMLATQLIMIVMLTAAIALLAIASA